MKKEQKKVKETKRVERGDEEYDKDTLFCPECGEVIEDIANNGDEYLERCPCGFVG